MAGVHFRLRGVEGVAAAVVVRGSVGVEAALQFLVDAQNVLLIVFHDGRQRMHDQMRKARPQRPDGLPGFQQLAQGSRLAADAVVFPLIDVIDAEIEMEAHRRRAGENRFERFRRAPGMLPVGGRIDVRGAVGCMRRQQNRRQIGPEKRLAAADKQVVDCAHRGQGLLELGQREIAVRPGVELVPVVAMDAALIAFRRDVERDERRRDAPAEGRARLDAEEMAQETSACSPLRQGKEPPRLPPNDSKRPARREAMKGAHCILK